MHEGVALAQLEHGPLQRAFPVRECRYARSGRRRIRMFRFCPEPVAEIYEIREHRYFPAGEILASVHPPSALCDLKRNEREARRAVLLRVIRDDLPGVERLFQLGVRGAV